MTSIDLAVIIGDCEEAIALNQISYWLEKYKEVNHNFKDGKYWVYNSYQKWSEDNFPFWHPSKIQRIFRSLEKKGLLISANYNKASFDKTKWYTIDYDKLQNMTDDYERKLCENKISSLDSESSLIENEQSSLEDDKPIPEDTTETTNRDYQTETTSTSPTEFNTSKDDLPLTGFNTSVSDETKQPKSKTFKWIAVKNQLVSTMKKFGYESDSEMTEGVVEVFRYYYSEYRSKMKKEHPILNEQTMIKVLQSYISFLKGCGRDYGSVMTLIEEHFDTHYVVDIDWNIQHFMTSGIMNILSERTK